MAFYSISKGNTSEEPSKYGRLYVLKFTLDDGTVLHKVGMCNSDRSTDRMMEILRDFFVKYRYVPRCEMRRDKKTIVPLLLEKHMHSLLDEWSYRFDEKFNGSTEFFSDIDESVLLDYLDNFNYRELLRNREPMKIEDYDSLCEYVREEDDKLKVEGTDILPF